jgi:hypothetical protein
MVSERTSRFNRVELPGHAPGSPLSRLCHEYDALMPRAVRLLTSADLVHSPEPHHFSVSARHEAVLDDGRRLLLLDDRGWSQTLHGQGANEIADGAALMTERDIAETARVVVGPDEPFGGRSQGDMESDHWNELVERLRVQGILVEADELKRLPHVVVLSEPLRARLARASAGDA